MPENLAPAGTPPAGNDGRRNVGSGPSVASASDDGHIVLPLDYDTVRQAAERLGFSLPAGVDTYMSQLSTSSHSVARITPPLPEQSLVFGAMPRGNVHIVPVRSGNTSILVACLPGGCPILFHTASQDGVQRGQAYITVRGLAGDVVRARANIDRLLETEIREKEQRRKHEGEELDGSISYLFDLNGAAYGFTPIARTNLGNYYQSRYSEGGDYLEKLKLVGKDISWEEALSTIPGLDRNGLDKRLTYAYLEHAGFTERGRTVPALMIIGETDHPRPHTLDELATRAAPTATYMQFKYDRDTPRIKPLREQHGAHEAYLKTKKTMPGLDIPLLSGQQRSEPRQEDEAVGVISPRRPRLRAGTAAKTPIGERAAAFLEELGEKAKELGKDVIHRILRIPSSLIASDGPKIPKPKQQGELPKWVVATALGLASLGGAGLLIRTLIQRPGSTVKYSAVEQPGSDLKAFAKTALAEKVRNHFFFIERGGSEKAAADHVMKFFQTPIAREMLNRSEYLLERAEENGETMEYLEFTQAFTGHCLAVSNPRFKTLLGNNKQLMEIGKRDVVILVDGEKSEVLITYNGAVRLWQQLSPLLEEAGVTSQEISSREGALIRERKNLDEFKFYPRSSQRAGGRGM